MAAKVCIVLACASRAKFKAEILINSHVMPALAYSAMAVRPSKQQVIRVRGATAKSAGQRHFATGIADALFLRRTHYHDPKLHETAVTYACMWGWRRALGKSGIAEQNVQWLESIFDPSDLTVTPEATSLRIQLRSPKEPI